MCHSSLLNDKSIFNLWQMSLQMGVCIRLFRDEVILLLRPPFDEFFFRLNECFECLSSQIFQTHHEIQQFFDSIKGYHKRSQEVKDCFSIALQQRYWATMLCSNHAFITFQYLALLFMLIGEDFFESRCESSVYSSRISQGCWGPKFFSCGWRYRSPGMR